MARTLFAFAATALAATALSAAAFAQPARINDASYVSAARCLAFAQLPQLASDAPDISTLKEAYDNNTSARNSYLYSQAREAERTVRRIARRSEDVNYLRARRDTACRPFAASGMVGAGHGAAQH